MFMSPLNFHNKIKVSDYLHLRDKEIKTQRQIKLFAQGHITNEWENSRAHASNPYPLRIQWTARSLVGCSPWYLEESDTTERLHFDFSLSCIGEGSGNPLQCSCLENPRDRGAWWAAVYGVTQSRT